MLSSASFLSKSVSLLHLEFSDPLLELRYERHSAAAEGWACDSVVASFWAFLVAELLLQKEPSWACYVVSGLSFLLAYGLKWVLGGERFAALRTAWTVVLRVIHHVVMAQAQVCSTAQSMLNGGLHSWKFLIAKDIASTIMITFGLRLKFAHHVLVHGPLMLFLPVANSYMFCQCEEQLADSQDMLELERKLDRSSNMIKTMLMAPFVLTNGDREAYTPCVQLTRFIFVFFGIFISCYLLWNLEKKSRVKFTEERMTKDVLVSSGQQPSNLKIGFVRHMFLMTVMYTICWEYIVWVPSLVRKWTHAL